MKIQIVLILLCFFYSTATAQDVQSDSLNQEKNLSLSVGSLLSTGNNAPFWLQGNNSQRLNTDPNTLFIEAAGVQPLFTKNRFRLDLGFDLIARQSEKTSGEIIQGYVQANLGKVALFGGRKEEIFGVRDTLLTIGPFVNGNNSLPVPKIALYSKDWIDIPFTKDYFQFQFYYAHGWFEKDRAVISPFLHQKYLYLQLSNESLPFSLFAGLTHQVQWGGTLRSSNEKAPSSIRDYTRILFGKSSLDDFNHGEFINALGNHLGDYNFGIEYYFGDWKLTNYWYIPYEDHSGLFVKNWKDGMIGLNLTKNRKGLLEGFLIEVFDTSSNDLSTGSDGTLFFEPDDFFNNFLYGSGWTYNDVTIGNPMFAIADINIYGARRVTNLVKGINTGVKGTIFGAATSIKYTYFENAGNKYTNYYEGTITQELHNVQVRIYKPLSSNLSLNGAVNYQWGSWASNDLGLLVQLTKRF